MVKLINLFPKDQEDVIKNILTKHNNDINDEFVKKYEAAIKKLKLYIEKQDIDNKAKSLMTPILWDNVADQSVVKHLDTFFNKAAIANLGNEYLIKTMFEEYKSISTEKKAKKLDLMLAIATGVTQCNLDETSTVTLFKYINQNSYLDEKKIKEFFASINKLDTGNINLNILHKFFDLYNEKNPKIDSVVFNKIINYYNSCHTELLSNKLANVFDKTFAAMSDTSYVLDPNKKDERVMLMWLFENKFLQKEMVEDRCAGHYKTAVDGAMEVVEGKKAQHSKTITEHRSTMVAFGFITKTAQELSRCFSNNPLQSATSGNIDQTGALKETFIKDIKDYTSFSWLKGINSSRKASANTLINKFKTIDTKDKGEFYEQSLKHLMQCQVDILDADSGKKKNTKGFSRLYDLTMTMQIKLVKQWAIDSEEGSLKCSEEMKKLSQTLLQKKILLIKYC